MKIGFFGVEDWQKKYLAGKLASDYPQLEVFFSETILDPDHLPAQTDLEIISIFVNSQITESVLAHFPQLKFIALQSTGFDNVDLAACALRDITVSNVPNYGENTVAEYTFALILTLSRKIFQAHDQIKETGSFSFRGLRGFDLQGKTLGVVGTGRIGRQVIKIAKGFDLKVVAHDSFPDQKAASELGFTYLPLPELLATSDIVTLHVPYLPETHHLLNTETLAEMKPTAILINTSRGAVVETAALVEALRVGKIAGAGLDVLEEEGVIKDELDFLAHGSVAGHDLKTIIANHVLLDLPNVIITPHNAFNTKEALSRILTSTLENIGHYLAGQPVNIVKV